MFRYFTIKFHNSFFAYFRFKFFASLRSETKQSKIQFNFLAFFSLFSFFLLKNFSLRFDLVIFASKRNEGENFFASKEANSIFFALFCFPISFRVKKHCYRFFRLIFVYFIFVFASDFWCFASKWIMWNKTCFASMLNKIFASISNFASYATVRAHPRHVPWLRSLLSFYHFTILHLNAF